MRELRTIPAGILALIAFSSCHAASSTSVVPPTTLAVPHGTNPCGSLEPGPTLTVCIHTPRVGTKVSVTDTIYGDADAKVSKPLHCPGSGTARLCAVSFTPPAYTLNQIGIDVSGTTHARGAFPVYLQSGPQARDVFIGGMIDSIAVVPFQSIDPTLPKSSLPIGQSEHVWTVASRAGSVVVGAYQKPITVSSDASALEHSLSTLKSSADAEKLVVTWSKSFIGDPASAHLRERIPGTNIKAGAQIDATSGIAYFTVGKNDPRNGPGPVAIAPDGSVYFVVNDDSDGGCRKPNACLTTLYRFTSPSSQPKAIGLTVPGISQLYFDVNGALWMASFQPAGTWKYALPGLLLPKGQFSASAVRYLPTSQFGEPSGFANDSAGNLWISSCQGSLCKQDNDGTPILLEMQASASQPGSPIQLNMNCTEFGYFGFSVGDVAYYKGSLYVLGLNDGSAPPARGALWTYTPASQANTCVPDLPANFNPSPYFGVIRQNASDNQGALVFGAGGNNANYRWQPTHGFYVFTGGGPPRWDANVGATANHISTIGSYGNPGSVLYYASSGKTDLRFSGLGTYQLDANPPGTWGIFPSASFSGDQTDNGVGAVSNGAWFTASGICGPWTGVCLAHAIYLKAWGALPQLMLPPVAVNQTAGIAAIINPAPNGSIVSLHAHSGPLFKGTGSGNGTCSVAQITKNTRLTFLVTGVHPGVCQITITEYVKKKAVSSQPLVTDITTPSPNLPR